MGLFFIFKCTAKDICMYADLQSHIFHECAIFHFDFHLRFVGGSFGFFFCSLLWLKYFLTLGREANLNVQMYNERKRKKDV